MTSLVLPGPSVETLAPSSARTPTARLIPTAWPLKTAPSPEQGLMAKHPSSHGGWAADRSEFLLVLFATAGVEEALWVSERSGPDPALTLQAMWP